MSPLYMYFFLGVVQRISIRGMWPRNVSLGSGRVGEAMGLSKISLFPLKLLQKCNDALLIYIPSIRSCKELGNTTTGEPQ